MFLDDRAQYPMTFFIELELSGDLDRDQFEKSVREALQRHPLLTSCIKKSFGRVAKWCPCGATPSIEWNEGAPVLPELNDRFIDLTREPGVRFFIGHNQDHSRVVAQFHHAATDGVGAIQFWGDVLALYGQKTAAAGQEVPELAAVRRETLSKRGQLWEEDYRHKRLLAHFLWWMWQVVPTHPVGLLSAEQQPSFARDPFVTRVVDGKQVRSIKRLANTLGVSPNELYTTAMFQMLKKWNLTAGHLDQSRDAYRVGIPFTLRTPSHSDSPAANILSYMFLTKSSLEISNPDQLLKYVHKTSAGVLDSGDRALMAWAIGHVRRFPGLLPAFTHLPVRFTTAMLANVGDVKRALRNRFPLDRGRCVAGNVTLEHLLGAAPIRPKTHLGLSLGTYAGKLFINLNCDPYKFSANESQKMADLFVQSVTNMLDEPEEMLPANEQARAGRAFVPVN